MATVLGRKTITFGATETTETIGYRYLVQTEAGEDFNDAKLAVVALTAPTGYLLKRLDGDTSTQNPRFHEVDVDYETPPFETPEEDPLLRPSEFSSNYEEFTEAYYKDADDVLVLNSVGDRFEGFPERKNGNLVLQITKNFETFPAVTYDDLKYTRNSVAVTIRGTTYAIGTLLMAPITAQEVREKVNGVWTTYYKTMFRIYADHGTHLHIFQDRGYFSLVGGVRRQILDVDGMPPPTPWPLDGSGAVLPPTSTPANKTFKPYESVNWGIDFS